ncbi:hypothetical protein HBE96_09990 [Clostridium sp. P21]|uniref:Uncharacterized protein n=1 Tax=Clostridium muellerianum TaxID=2716538 RepID=A0A7Y0EGE9_9CLOT|nr:hypothetical protein [Clostridium muellerianum]NMM63026.1 hypothetical protein [Clostridium muellerianum]
MEKLSKCAIIFILSSVIFTMFITYSNKQNSKNTLDMDQFVNLMKAKSYKFELKDVEKDFLPTTRKRMIIDKEAINIYLYNSNKEVENDAKRIDDGGCEYSDGTKSINVSWTSYPHFYKKGSIIVQYVGKNEKVISDLKDIFGEQFAGYK